MFSDQVKDTAAFKDLKGKYKKDKNLSETDSVNEDQQQALK